MISDRVYGFSTIWVNPYQARVCTIEEVVRQQFTLVPSGPNWPYALVKLNGDTCHAPLPREGYLSIQPEGGTSSATCGMVSQLEVCWLLSSGLQVIYPVGLNGCETPVIVSPSKSLARGTKLLGGKPIYLKVGILQSMVEGPKLKVLPSGICPSILMASSIKATLPKAEREVSMTMEVRELLSWEVLDTSGLPSANSTPKRLNPCGHTHTSAPQIGRSFKSSGHIIPGECLRWCWDGGSLLGGNPPAPSPTAETPGPSSGTPPKDAGHLWEEATKALGELLATKSSIDPCQWKLFWELGMALCQNESQTTESIKQA